MRIKSLFFITIAILIFNSCVIGQDMKTDSQDIEQFKDKLASKVAELQKKDEKAFSGFVTEINGKEISFKTNDNETFIAEIDDVLTKFYSLITGVKKEIQLEDINKDTYIIVTGPINGKIITANNIYIDTHYLSDSGIINEVNSTDYSIKVSLIENESLTVDIETSTKKYSINPESFKLETIGFSKIKSGDTIHFIYEKTNSSKAEKRYSAEKIIIIPQEYFSK